LLGGTGHLQNPIEVECVKRAYSGFMNEYRAALTQTGKRERRPQIATKNRQNRFAHLLDFQLWA
jgi:hypothetical protein